MDSAFRNWFRFKNWANNCRFYWDNKLSFLFLHSNVLLIEELSSTLIGYLSNLYLVMSCSINNLSNFLKVKLPLTATPVLWVLAFGSSALPPHLNYFQGFIIIFKDTDQTSSVYTSPPDCLVTSRWSATELLMDADAPYQCILAGLAECWIPKDLPESIIL